MVVLRYGVSLFAAICAIRVMVVFDLDGRTLAMCFAPVVVGLAGVAEVVGSRAVARLTIAVWSVVVVGLSVVAAAEFRSHGSGGSSAALAPMRADLRSDGFGRALAGCQVSSNRPQMVWLARSEEVPYFDQETREHPHGCVVVLSGFDEITPPASWGCAFSTADVAVYRADLSASTLCPGADTSRVSG